MIPPLASTLRDRLLAMADDLSASTVDRSRRGVTLGSLADELRREASALVPAETGREEIRLIAKAIAWDEAGDETNGYASWENNHSCGGYGCCGGGKDIDRNILAKLIADALLAALSSSPVQPEPVTPSSVATGAGATEEHDALTRSERLDVQPTPQPAATDTKG